jgi:hypothetical protein
LEGKERQKKGKRDVIVVYSSEELGEVCGEEGARAVEQAGRLLLAG